MRKMRVNKPPVRRRTMAAVAVAASCVVLPMTGATATAAGSVHAASYPTFTVMNTSEQPPDGVYFRNSPHTADYSPIAGYGVYRGERVEAGCYAFGDAVGQYGNRVWYFANNVTRPTAGGRNNYGWLNTHYINDGQTANHVAPGVPSCY